MISCDVFSTKKTGIIVMVTNPEPGNNISFKNSEGTVAMGHPDRPDVLAFIDALETQ